MNTPANQTDPNQPHQKAPDFELGDQQGQTHRLSQYLGQWVILYFYPKDDTPGCTSEACQFRDQFPSFNQLKAVILGLSPDDGDSHDRFTQKYNLPFTLLADTERKVCQLYDVWKEKTMYGQTRMGVVRTTVLIDPQGRIAHRWNNVKVDGHADQVLQAIHEASPSPKH